MSEFRGQVKAGETLWVFNIRLSNSGRIKKNYPPSLITFKSDIDMNAMLYAIKDSIEPNPAVFSGVKFYKTLSEAEEAYCNTVKKVVDEFKRSKEKIERDILQMEKLIEFKGVIPKVKKSKKSTITI